VLGIAAPGVGLRGRLSILPQDARFAANVPVIEQIVFFSQLNGRTWPTPRRTPAGARPVGLSVAKREHAVAAYKGWASLRRSSATPGVLLDEPTAGWTGLAGIRIIST
jgi:hypothetical protein